MTQDTLKEAILLNEEIAITNEKIRCFEENNRIKIVLVNTFFEAEYDVLPDNDFVIERLKSAIKEYLVNKQIELNIKFQSL